MSEAITELMMDNARKLGKCLGVMKFLIEHGDMTDFDWRQLARVYVSVSGEDPHSQDSVEWIRAEAVRRGVDIGE
jgi:hypothetical protein